MLRKVLAFAISSGLAAAAWKALQARWQAQRAARRQAEREPLQQWEGGGGALVPGSDPR